jgi:hypothetical protein
MESKTSRRGFIAALGTPMILGAANKSGSNLPVIGEGAYKYEVIHDWGALPANIKYGNTHGVCEDSQGNIYVHHTVNADSESHDTMVVFDAKGKFVKSWGKDFKGGAHGLHIRKEGKQEFLYLCDTKRAVVVKTTTSGEEVFAIRYPVESEQYKPDAEGKKKKYSPNQSGCGPERRYLCRRRLRVQLHQPIQFEGRIHPNLWRRRFGARTAFLPSRINGGYAWLGTNPHRSGPLE